MDTNPILTNARWPTQVPETRYGGNGIDWSIKKLADADQLALMRGYRAVLRLLDESFEVPLSDSATIEKIADWMLRSDWQSVRRDLAAVGPDTYAEFGTSPVLRKVLHDLRGGPMTSLAIDLGFIRATDVRATSTHIAFSYWRAMSAKSYEIAFRI